MDIPQRIARQADSLAAVCDYFEGDGRDALEEAAEQARGAGSICFAGMGGSRYALMPAATFLQTHGLPVACVDASEQLYYGALPAKSAVFIMSRSGRTVEAVKLARKLTAEGHRVIAVSTLR